MTDTEKSSMVVRMDKDVYERLKEDAYQRRTDISKLIRALVDIHLDQAVAEVTRRLVLLVARWDSEPDAYYDQIVITGFGEESSAFTLTDLRILAEHLSRLGTALPVSGR